MSQNDAESLMRKIEVKRIFDNPGDFFTVEEILATIELFISIADKSEDWRYLNTALKLNDSLHKLGQPSADVENLITESVKKLRRFSGVCQ